MLKSGKNEPKVITFYELLGIIALALLLLTLFFPKNSVENMIEKEKRNYDLSVIYLKSIAKAYPENPDNWLRLIKAYLVTGKTEDAKKAFGEFKKYITPDYDESLIIGYQLIKGEYLIKKDKNIKSKLLHELKNELENFLKSPNPSLWYFALIESKRLDLKQTEFEALKKRLYNEKDIDPQNVIRAFFLARQIKKSDEGVKLLEFCLSKSNAKELFDLLLSHYSSKKEYLKIAKLYEKEFLRTGTRDSFLNAARFYLVGGDKKRALFYIKKRRNDFLDDPIAAYKIIRLYLSYTELKEAESFVTLLMRKSPLWLQKDKKLLQISLDVMLYGGKLEKAAKLADIGVENFKSDLFWVKKALLISSWRNDILNIRSYAEELYKKDKSAEYADILLKAAKSSNDTDTIVEIYIDKLSSRYDKDDLKKLFSLFMSEGNFERGVAFFDSYYKKHPEKEILRSKIALESEYADFESFSKSFENFTLKYGFDSLLLYQYTHRLFSLKNYTKAYRLLEKNMHEFTKNDKKLWFLYADLAFILQKEDRLLNILEKMRKYAILRKGDFERLFFLYLKKDPQKAFLVAKKDYENSYEKRSFYRLVSIATRLDKKDFLTKTIDSVNTQLLKELEKDSYFHILKASDYLRKNRERDAYAEYKTAISLDPLSKEAHASYLWFLISYEKKRALEKELDFIYKNRILNADIALAASSGYFLLQDAVTAKRYMKIVLKKRPRDWRAHLQYCDILSLNGEYEASRKHMIIAKSLANKAKKNEEFKNDKSALYDYLRLKIGFNPLKSGYYLNSQKERLDPGSLHRLYISALMDTDAKERVEYVAKRYETDDFYTALYLALNKNDTAALKDLLEKKSLPPLSDHLAALEKTGALSEYGTLLFEALKKSEDHRYRKLFYEYISKNEPLYKIGFSHADLSVVKYDELSFEAKNILRGSFDFDLKFGKKTNMKNENKTLKDQNHLSFKLRKSFKNYRLSFWASLFDRTKIYPALKSRLSYSTGRGMVEFGAGINQNDESSAYLQLYGKKRYLNILWRYETDRDGSIHFGYEYASYKDLKRSLGDGERLTMGYNRSIKSANRDLDISFVTEYKSYTKNAHLPKTFIQAAVSATYANGLKTDIDGRRKSYLNCSLLYNSVSGPGYSLGGGYALRTDSGDYLGFEADYSSGAAGRLQEYFVWRIRYIFR